jgi:hypothetical protein
MYKIEQDKTIGLVQYISLEKAKVLYLLISVSLD